MRTTQITGPTGSGKSSLISEIGKGYRICLIDPLAKSASVKKRWEAPAEPVDAVIFDHVLQLATPSEDVAAALTWCRQHRANLVLITMSAGDLDYLGIHAPIDAVMNLKRSSEHNGFTIATENEELTGSLTGHGFTKELRACLDLLVGKSA